MTQVGSRTLTYDANGNLAADGYRTLAWNAANQLSQVTMQNGAIAHYEYDFTGARVQQRVVTQNTYGAPEGWEIYTLSEALELRVPLQWPGSQSGTDPPDGAGQAPVANLAQATATLHVLVGGQRIASRGVVEVVGDAPKGAVAKSAAEWFIYHHTDHLGSSHLMTEGRSAGHYAGLTYPKGSVVQRFAYAAFGSETFALNPNLPFDPRFTDQTYDLDTGLYYYRARYYDPALARFISPDTLVPDPTTPHSYNRYTYVRNNPLRWVDPTGHYESADAFDPDAAAANDRQNDRAVDFYGFDLMDALETAPSASNPHSDPQSTIREITTARDTTIGQKPSSNWVERLASPSPTTVPEHPWHQPNTEVTLDDTKQGYSIVAGVGGSLVAISGVEANVGVVVSVGEKIDLGVFGSIGPAAGVNISADIFAGYISSPNIQGVTNNINVVGGLISGTVLTDASTGQVVGGTIGFGPSFPLVGASGSESFTGDITARELLR